jgi:hypothetical protein
MPRKTALDVDPSLRAAVEEFGALGFVKEEAARAVYEYQDEDTKAAIDSVVDVLTANATGVVTFSERRTSSGSACRLCQTSQPLGSRSPTSSSTRVTVPCAERSWHEC